MSTLTRISLALALATTISAPAFAGKNGSDWINRARPAPSAQSNFDARAEFAKPAPTTTRHAEPHTYFGGPRSIH